MTNTFEGSIFVSSTIEANQTVTDYVTQLMPQFNEKQVQVGNGCLHAMTRWQAP